MEELQSETKLLWYVNETEKSLVKNPLNELRYVVKAMIRLDRS